ncbi:MAG: CapA family protein [Candidatus Margulisbacteria bacterium]|nr:CapA family protein [Candidatus Margulisiibacteriota bacterium]
MIELAFVGDIMLARGVGEFLSKHSNHIIISEQVKNILKGADLCVGNLESPVAVNAEPIKKNAFKANPETLKQIYIFDIFSLANNHIKDCETEGAIETTEILKENLFEFLGLSDNHNLPINPIFKTIKNKNIAFFACAVPDCIKNEKANDFPRVIDATSKYFLDAISYHKEKSDFTVILVHGGNEMIPYPEPNFRNLCQNFIDCGADFVITSHPHVLGGHEKYKAGYIFYSLGDFIFDADSFLRRESAILKIKIKDSISWEYIPTTISKNFRVVLVEKTLNDKIISKINLVSTRLKSFDYNKKYSSYYQSSLRQFQKDRIIYKLKNKGILHVLGFLIKKITLIPHYSKKLLLKQYK